MGKSPAAINENSILAPESNLHATEKVSTPGQVVIGSPLTPVEHVPLSTPHAPSSRCQLFHQNEDNDDSNDDIDAICYDSDGNPPPVATLDDTFHAEPEVSTENEDANIKNFEELKFVLLTEKEIKKLRVDELRKELHIRGVSHQRKKWILWSG